MNAQNMNKEMKASAIAYEYLKEQILNGTLQIGSKLPPERDIATQLNISRNPVREALRTLEMMGFIEAIHGSGNYICCNIQGYMKEAFSMKMALEDTKYMDLFETRRALELSSLRPAMERKTAEDVEELRKIFQQMEEAGSIAESARLDVRFHQILTQMSRNPVLIGETVVMSEITDLFIHNIRAAVLRDKRRAALLSKAHRDIFEAMEQGDLEKAVAAMNQHFDTIEEYVGKTEKDFRKNR
ncbi:MAG: FadR/GntR family transcriptional regulator [Hespellia sp.]|nr:FadR/GntR family transcriptional regulator [Hespellia sp.]